MFTNLFSSSFRCLTCVSEPRECFLLTVHQHPQKLLYLRIPSVHQLAQLLLSLPHLVLPQRPLTLTPQLFKTTLYIKTLNPIECPLLTVHQTSTKLLDLNSYSQKWHQFCLQ